MSLLHILLPVVVMVPLAGFLLGLLMPPENERLNSGTAFVFIAVYWCCLLVSLAVWVVEGFPVVNIREMVLFATPGYEYLIDFYFDRISAVYLVVGGLLTLLITIYSRYYMHRERGYKRFFNTIMFFFLGYNIVVLSGNLETMFVGWEILGVSSFLLIAFYRDRYLPVRNAVKVFSVYRLADVGLIVAMWMSHHLWHENPTFLKLANAGLVHAQLEEHTVTGFVVSLMILLSAAAKSAQLPFSSWLPRAMEGPTPSSAIFYGSLSVHIGVFLLLRTFPFWEHQLSVRVMIGLVGLVTALVATGTARVQSSVKSQIAYSSIAQIGIIFIEVALGLELLALVHFAGNAFLRTYQLLVSPSVVSYLIREQFYNFQPRLKTLEDTWPRRMAYALYILCLREWDMDAMMYRYLWNPLKAAGAKLDFLARPAAVVSLALVFCIGVLLRLNESVVPNRIHVLLPVAFAFIGLVSVLKSFTERRHAHRAWVLASTSHFWVVLAISFNEHFGMEEAVLYLAGVVAFGIAGWGILRRVRRLEGDIDLNRFHGASWAHPRLGLIFLLCSLAVAGFPITPTFIGEDLLFSHIHDDQIVLAAMTALQLIVTGIAIIRIYSRVFMGPHTPSVYEMGYRSS